MAVAGGDLGAPVLTHERSSCQNLSRTSPMLDSMSPVDDTKTTALVTGASSGVGFETAFQLAQSGYRHVILGCRTLAKGEDARRRLLARGANDVFETLAVDVSEVSSSSSASEELLARERKLDLVILNAGIAGASTPEKSSTGVDQTFASSLVGHHVLTMKLLQGGSQATVGSSSPDRRRRVGTSSA